MSKGHIKQRKLINALCRLERGAHANKHNHEQHLQSRLGKRDAARVAAHMAQLDAAEAVSDVT